MSDIQDQTMPAILPGDIIAVYSIHESAWGNPAKTYCVRRVETDGTPVSDMNFHHFLSDVVSISRKEGDNYVCIWKKDNYETPPWGETAINDYLTEMLPKGASEAHIAMCAEQLKEFCNKNPGMLAKMFVYDMCKKFTLAKKEGTK